MARLPEYGPDAAIKKLLAERPLPTATIAARLGLPTRTARHRLLQLRRSETVTRGTDGVYRLATALAAPTVSPDSAGDTTAMAVTSPLGATLPRGWWIVAGMMTLAIIALTALARPRRTELPRSLAPPTTDWSPWADW